MRPLTSVIAKAVKKVVWADSAKNSATAAGSKKEKLNRVSNVPVMRKITVRCIRFLSA
jgi:hypothetical protein